MKKLFLGIFILSILSNLAFADLNADITAVSTEMMGQELPGSLGKFLGKDNINVYIKMASGEDKVLGISTENKKITKFEIGELTEPSLKVHTSEETLTEIFSSQTSIATMNRVLKEGKVIYEAVGFKNKMKFGMAVLFLKMFGEKETKVEENQLGPNVKLKEKKKEETKPAEKKEEKKEEAKAKVEEKKEEVKVKANTTSEAVVKPTTHVIEVKKEGFVPAELTIKVGDTVEWKVIRPETINTAMILGTQNCVNVKSKILKNGESFKWKFDKAETCTIADGIITTQIGKVIIG